MLSFKKRTTEIPIPGTQTSLQNGQTITSSGNPSLDHVIGGGVPIGSLLLIEEDRFVTYSNVLGKYFLAEGVACNQSLFLATLEETPSDVIRKLPKPVVVDETKSSVPKPTDSEDMRIAWRYNNLPKVDPEQITSKIGHNFNLLEQLSEEEVAKADVTTWDGSTVGNSSIFHCGKFFTLLDGIKNTLKSDKFSLTESGSDKSLLRICIQSLASPLWYEEGHADDLLKFLTILRAIVRNHNAVCFLTIPSHLLAKLDETLIPQIRNLVDYSIELESFAGSDKETNPIFKEYNGLLHIRKIFAVNTLAVYVPETTDLAFKLRRKKFVVEKLHLPPELQEADQTNQDEIVPSLSCGSNTKNLLEF